MKVTANRQPKQFNPIKLEITIESHEEALALHDVFNLARITGPLGRAGVNHTAIRESIAGALGTDSISLGTGPVYHDVIRFIH